MKIKTRYFLLFFIALISLASCGKKNSKARLEIIMVNEGFGYDIYIDNKKCFHQDVIPAISKIKPFSSREDAEKVGRLVIEKLKSRKLPAVSEKELEELGIDTNS